MHIPFISPVEITLGEPGIRRLPAPDYEIHALPPAAVMSIESAPHDPAIVALDEIERSARISEYHDFTWWDGRIKLIRGRLEQQRPD